MLRSPRYLVSHCLRALMTKLQDATPGMAAAGGDDGGAGRAGSGDAAGMRASVRYLGLLADVTLLVAVCVGLFARWERTDNALLLVLFVLGLLVLALACVLCYYFSMERAGGSLANLWFGFLLGLLALLDTKDAALDVKEEATRYLLLTSVALKLLWALVERVCGYTRRTPTLVTGAELLQLLGFSVASTAMLAPQCANVVLLACAVGLCIADLRMKSFLAPLNLVAFSLLTALLFFPSLGVSVNPYALGCFFGRLVAGPLLDLYFCGLSVTERWQPYLQMRNSLRRLSVLALAATELFFLALSACALADLHRWYIVIPGFVVFGILWLGCHLALVASLWAFHNKLTDCLGAYTLLRASGKGLDGVMASRGMRHFCLVAERLVFGALMSTSLLGAVCWQAHNGTFMAAFLIILPLESLLFGLFHELGSCLGGTCVGYALIIPTAYCSPDGQPLLLPPELVESLNVRSTGTLHTVQRFFAHHMVETFGCDYCTSGLTLEYLQAKLRTFFDMRTQDGPRHDTYILYYSGHTHSTGDWALAGRPSSSGGYSAGGESLKLETLLEWWKERSGPHPCRLIVVLDCESGAQWARDVRRLAGPQGFVAVQAAVIFRTASDADAVVTMDGAGASLPGEFTRRWVDFNCGGGAATWEEKCGSAGAVYGVSSSWGDYRMRVPEDAAAGSAYFPRPLRPLVRAASCACCDRLGGFGLGLGLGVLCEVCSRCFRRIKLRWFPPAALDTGHGFKLVKS
ncbi:transmembrane protein 168 isoform X1 [Lethenteron reissneri]|uniref:transmembrane protein 168 isoform X1 n=1 Tax=Lethenteron reissneri TaxID=7753 RepID=UPI002AB690AA|nr:transmembrane protein 168 isoform X1 [Lethenteron reissneri]